MDRSKIQFPGRGEGPDFKMIYAIWNTFKEKLLMSAHTVLVQDSVFAHIFKVHGDGDVVVLCSILDGW